MKRDALQPRAAAFAGGQSLVYPDLESLSQAVAEWFVCLADLYSGLSMHFTVALAGGSTPQRLYEILAEPANRNRIEWTRVHLFWGDERCVPPHDPESNYGSFQEIFLTRVPIPPDHVHRVRGELHPEEAASAYETELRDAGLDRQPFSLALLGVGEDGHTASLFSGSAALVEKARLAVPVYAAHLQSWRVTLTLPVLNRAEQTAFLVSGVSKRAALTQVMDGRPLPALLARSHLGTTTWFVDQAAFPKGTS